MKIAVLTSGRLPVPAVLGGAVENLIDFYMEYNKAHHLHDITVYSIRHDKIVKPDTECNHYYYVDVKSIGARIAKKIYSYFNKSAYYDSEIEYFLYKSLKHLKRQHYDCIILENRPGYAMAVKKVSDAPIILHLHNDLLNKDLRRGREMYECITKVLTVSNFIKGRVEILGTAVPVETVYNGINLDRFQTKICNSKVRREELNLRADDFVAVFSGRLTKEKGIKELLQAFLLLKDYPSIKLLVMGSGFYGGDSAKNVSPFMEDLQQLADRMSEKVVFTGFVDYNSVPDYLRLADIAVVPSMWEEPFALTCVEALASGLPLIATNSGGIMESCGECAIIVEKSNVVAGVAEAILSLYNDKQLCGEMCKKNLHIAHNYNKEQYADNFLNAL